MASHESAQELLLDVKVAEASRFYKFYLNQEKKILGTISISIFLIAWELVGNVFQWINPMFMKRALVDFQSRPGDVSLRRNLSRLVCQRHRISRRLLSRCGGGHTVRHSGGLVQTNELRI